MKVFLFLLYVSYKQRCRDAKFRIVTFHIKIKNEHERNTVDDDNNNDDDVIIIIIVDRIPFVFILYARSASFVSFWHFTQGVLVIHDQRALLSGDTVVSQR